MLVIVKMDQRICLVYFRQSIILRLTIRWMFFARVTSSIHFWFLLTRQTCVRWDYPCFADYYSLSSFTFREGGGVFSFSKFGLTFLGLFGENIQFQYIGIIGLPRSIVSLYTYFISLYFSLFLDWLTDQRTAKTCVAIHLKFWGNV